MSTRNRILNNFIKLFYFATEKLFNFSFNLKCLLFISLWQCKTKILISIFLASYFTWYTLCDRLGYD